MQVAVSCNKIFLMIFSVSCPSMAMTAVQELYCEYPFHFVELLKRPQNRIENKL